MAILSESTVVAAKQHLSCDLEQEAVLLDAKKGIYYGLNPVGNFIWKFIQTPKKVGEIRDAVLAEFEVSREECERDVTQLVAQLIESGLAESRQG